MLAEPAGVAALGGAVYFASTADHRIHRVENGKVSTVAGGDPAPLEDGCAGEVRLASPMGVDLDPATGNVYFSDTLHHAVRAIGPDGAVVTVAGGTPGARDHEFE